MKAFLLITALLLSPAFAQFGWDEEPSTDTVLDQYNTSLRTPVIEPLESAYFPTFDPPPVTQPAAAPVFQPFVAPVVDVDPLVEQCDLEPEVAEVYGASALSESTRHSPQVTRHSGFAAYDTQTPLLPSRPSVQ